MRFFVYGLVDPRCGTTFYVGKGQRNRPQSHIAEAVRGKRSRKCARIREILADGRSVKAVILERFDDEEAAYQYEIEKIAEIGLINLTNVLPGGRGGEMSKAVTIAEHLPAGMIEGIARVLLLAHKGLRVTWGGMDVTRFAGESIQRLRVRLGSEVVDKRFSARGYRLVTSQYNGIC